MEDLVGLNLFKGVYERLRVFITGHTGFKGSWLAFWLKELGAEVKGYSLAPDTEPSHWVELGLDIDSIYADIRDLEKLQSEMAAFKPDIVFHLAAQPIVRISYEHPIETYEINVIGSAKVIEACRKAGSVRAIINVTTDKCYENREWAWGYREDDRLGGYDPYSSSKACSEIMTCSFRNSFFNLKEYGTAHQTLMATARAGNVIGGGDWATDRLIPDIMRAAARNKPTRVRNPGATRPWQHVLEPLSGYLLLGSELLNGNKEAAESWNFGPYDSSNLTVKQVCDFLAGNWNKIAFDSHLSSQGPHEAGLLKLDCSKANKVLDWVPVWDNEICFIKTAHWYRDFYQSNTLNTLNDLQEYVKSAIQKKMSWTR
jgi:CDP-glucose 4,6-dehydratase